MSTGAVVNIKVDSGCYFRSCSSHLPQPEEILLTIYHLRFFPERLSQRLMTRMSVDHIRCEIVRRAMNENEISPQIILIFFSKKSFHVE